ncbi:MAG: hypothetical protein P4L90_00040 [Rhodopila sp.]|nr:hypothetical protein [Rhodopila sp.]
MVSLAVWILTIAVAAGAALALWHIRAAEGTARPPLAAGIVHGIIGGAGLAVLLVALRGPARGVEAGAGSFGTISAVLFASALLIGLVVLALRRNTVVMAIHAGIAIFGYALLLAWSSLG